MKTTEYLLVANLAKLRIAADILQGLATIEPCPDWVLDEIKSRLAELIANHDWAVDDARKPVRAESG